MDAAPGPKGLKKLASVLPQTMLVEAPSSDNRAGIEISVLTAGDGSPLFIEVSAENIDYLHHAFLEQQEKPPTSQGS